MENIELSIIFFHHLNRLSRNEVGSSPTVAATMSVSVFREAGRPIGGSDSITLKRADARKMHLYILLNCDAVDMFIREFDEQFCTGLNGDAERTVMRQTHFQDWFNAAMENKVYREGTTELLALSRQPKLRVRRYNRYIVNGFRFHTMSYGSCRRSCNTGVCVRASDDDEASNWYGFLEDVLELRFGLYTVVMFKCQWYDITNNNGIWTQPELGLVEVNPTRRWTGDDPYVLATQVSQVYYAPSPGTQKRKATVNGRRGWLAAIPTRARHVITTLARAGEVDQELPRTNRPDEVYQDDTIPRFPVAATDDVADDDPIDLATGELLPVTDPVTRGGEPDAAAWGFMDDDLEHFSDDSYQSDDSDGQNQ